MKVTQKQLAVLNALPGFWDVEDIDIETDDHGFVTATNPKNEKNIVIRRNGYVPAIHIAEAAK